MAKKMSKIEVKQQAQDMLLHAALTAFYRAGDEGMPQEVTDELHKQFNRLEKTFGYEVGSWQA